MKFQERIPKLVIKPSEIDGQDMFGLNLNDNTTTCRDCGSHLFYLKQELGVVAEENEFGIYNNLSNRTYNIRPVGLVLYCAECGEFEENYVNFCYDKDTIVCTWNELGDTEKVEIEYCLNQWDQKGDFTPQYKGIETITLKEKLKEYEKKHPIKSLIKPKKKTKTSPKKISFVGKKQPGKRKNKR